MKRLGLHTALQLAVDVLRSRHGLQFQERLQAADELREFLGGKRLRSKLSMRKLRGKEQHGKKKSRRN
jgi:hypothetical protein